MPSTDEEIFTLESILHATSFDYRDFSIRQAFIFFRIGRQRPYRDGRVIRRKSDTRRPRLCGFLLGSLIRRILFNRVNTCAVSSLDGMILRGRCGRIGAPNRLMMISGASGGAREALLAKITDDDDAMQYAAQYAHTFTEYLSLLITAMLSRAWPSRHDDCGSQVRNASRISRRTAKIHFTAKYLKLMIWHARRA